MPNTGTSPLYVMDESGAYIPADPALVVEQAKALLTQQVNRDQSVDSPGAATDLLRCLFHEAKSEKFAALWLDTRHRVISAEVLFNGTINGAAVYPREVLRSCMGHNAAAVIFAHNHPSGVAEPSQADRQLTDRLTEVLGLVDCRVLDHIIFGSGEHASFAQRGLL